MRYVICREGQLGVGSGSSKDILEGEWFDLPIFILYLALGQHLKIGNLEKCIALGKIKPCGEIQISTQLQTKILSTQEIESFIYFGLEDLKNREPLKEEGLKIISLENLFESLPNFYFKQV